MNDSGKAFLRDEVEVISPSPSGPEADEYSNTDAMLSPATTSGLPAETSYSCTEPLPDVPGPLVGNCPMTLHGIANRVS